MFKKLKKHAKLFTLMTGVAIGPLTFAQKDLISNGQDDYPKTFSEEVEFSDKLDALEAILNGRAEAPSPPPQQDLIELLGLLEEPEAIHLTPVSDANGSQASTETKDGEKASFSLDSKSNVTVQTNQTIKASLSESEMKISSGITNNIPASEEVKITNEPVVEEKRKAEEILVQQVVLNVKSDTPVLETTSEAEGSAVKDSQKIQNSLHPEVKSNVMDNDTTSLPQTNRLHEITNLDKTPISAPFDNSKDESKSNTNPLGENKSEYPVQGSTGAGEVIGAILLMSFLLTGGLLMADKLEQKKFIEKVKAKALKKKTKIQNAVKPQNLANKKSQEAKENVQKAVALMQQQAPKTPLLELKNDVQKPDIRFAHFAPAPDFVYRSDKNKTPQDVEKTEHGAEVNPVVEEVIKPISNSKVSSINEKETKPCGSESEQYQKGIRMLGINKMKRSILRQQKKELTAELETANETRKQEILALLDENAIKGKQLSKERRQACAMIRGKQGEQEKEQRRLYAKRMAQLRRQMKKDGLDHSEEIEQINAARLAMKEACKAQMAQAKKEVDMRIQLANYKHGIRLLHEAQTSQDNLNHIVKELKKETGLKSKKEVLLTDFALWNEQRRVILKKRQAVKLIKGRDFIRQKTQLGKQMKAALSDQNMPLAEQIAQQLTMVQQAEKNHISENKKMNYTEKRIDLINPFTAERIHARRSNEQTRLETAHFLQGQRMLYHLKNGLSSAVNEKLITPKRYEKKAKSLIGNKTEPFDYIKQRCSYLKDATLAGIYRRQKQMDR